MSQEVHTIYDSKASDILEALRNLTYLICEDAKYPEKVQNYASMCEERLEAMKHLLAANNID